MYKEQSVFWQRILIGNCRPRLGMTYDNKHKTQANYKRDVKYVGKNQSNLRTEKMASAFKCQDKLYNLID